LIAQGEAGAVIVICKVSYARKKRRTKSYSKHRNTREKKTSFARLEDDTEKSNGEW